MEEKFIPSIAEKISKIPDKNLQEPKMSILGPTLEASKFYIEELQEKAKGNRIMTAIERREFLTKLILKEETKDTDRLKAVDILNKMDGEYTQKVEVNGNINSNPFSNLTTEELKKIIKD